MDTDRSNTRLHRLGSLPIVALVLSLAPLCGEVTPVHAAIAALPLSVGYADTHHPPSKGTFPSPWFGSPNTVFIGTTTNDWDSGAIKIDNTTGADVSGVDVAVDIGTAHYHLWGSAITIPAGRSLILTQMNDIFIDFDTSDNSPNPPGFPTANCTASSAIPVIHVTVSGTTFNYSDSRQIMNTGGVDSAHCGVGGDESQQWVLIGGSAPQPLPAPAPVPPTPTPTPAPVPPTPTPTPLPAGIAPDLAVGFAEATQQPGSWSVSAGYTLVVNWDGSVGSRPLAIADALVGSGTSVTGPILTNANAQFASGGSLLLLRGSGLAVHGTTNAARVAGVNGGSSATVPTPVGMQAGDLVAVYINTPNTMVAPVGWTLQHHDGQGTVWTQAFSTVPGSLSSWSTGGGASGWTFAAVSIGASASTPQVVAAGGGGAQTSRVVSTGTVVRP